jgi:F-type H+-transporting ATPase subunit b
MDQIISTFGIDWRLIAIQVFNFLILLGVLRYFLYTPLLNMLDARKRLIVQGIEDAKVAGESRALAETEKNVVLAKAVDEASQIVKRGEEAAKRDAATIVQDAHTQSARIMNESEKKARAVADALKKESEAEIAKTALLAAEKILRERAS